MIWVSPIEDVPPGGPAPEPFEFDDPEARIDYPVWSPDGRWALLDRFQPQGGDVRVSDGFWLVRPERDGGEAKRKRGRRHAPSRFFRPRQGRRIRDQG